MLHFGTKKGLLESEVGLRLSLLLCRCSSVSETECDLLDTTETFLSSKPKLPLPITTGEFTFLSAGTQDAKLAKIVAAYKGVYLKEGVKSLLAPNVD